jgi:predicted nucleic acid-binding protein
MGLQNKKEINELLKIFSKGHNTIFTHKTPKLKIIKDDPDDNKFIKCAVELEAKYIISGDKHLKEIKKYMNIWIVNPMEFLKIMN